MSDPAEQPMKRKRGRPPKQNKPADAFPTFTLQFQTSPESGSPSAELNSSMMVKMGEPDSFTPLMRVSPSIPKKRRRKYSSSSLASDPLPSNYRHTAFHEPRGSFLATPARTGSRAQANMSMITNDNDPYAPLAQLDTPPNSALKPSFHHSKLTGSAPTLSEKRRPPLLRIASQPGPSLDDPFSLDFKSDFTEKMKPTESDLSKSGECLSTDPAPMLSMSFLDDNNFSLRLTVDDEGRAVLSKSSQPGSLDERLLSQAKSPGQTPGKFLDEFAHTPDSSAESADRSDKFIVPQTPKGRDLFINDFTPSMEAVAGNLPYNLTPQFNSMMNLVMNMDSPMSPVSKKAVAPRILTPLQDSTGFFKKPLGFTDYAVDTAVLVGGTENTEMLDLVDDGDARAALKKMFKRM